MLHNIAQPPALCAPTAVKGPIGLRGAKSGSMTGGGLPTRQLLRWARDGA